MAYDLKPFTLNINDLKYLLAQVNFVPLFDANGNGLVAFDGSVDAYNAKNPPVKLWDAATHQLTPQAMQLGLTSLADLGTGFPQLSSSIGIRDVSGVHNNLFGDQAFWGTVDVPFRRDIPADYTKYVTSGANYDPTSGNLNVTDTMPRIISRTITTAGVNLLQDVAGVLGVPGAFIEWDSARYVPGSDYAVLIDAAGVDVSKLVEGAKIVAPMGLTLSWDPALDSASLQYDTLLAFVAGLSVGDVLYGPNGATLVDGMAVHYKVGTTFVPVGVNFDANLAIYHSLVVASGVNTANLASGSPITITPADVTEAINAIAADIGGAVAQATANDLLTADSGYGLLQTLGHIDFQNPSSGEYFIGSENPGVAPVNSWFGIFGQFFDHGLDKLGAGGNGKITIALETTDPLYRAPGTLGADDPGNTKITVTRATIAGTDANGDAQYINHTSPFIDQSQTYGSHEQLTNLLRKWVSTDGGATYHAGMELFDGTTLVDTWQRRWPDGTTEDVHDTLPTLSELRNHVADTDREELTWDDVANLRNRDASGHVISGNSGSPLLLDMNPLFDAAHLGSNQEVGKLPGDTVASRVTAAVGVLNANIATAVQGMPGYAANNVGRNGAGDSLTQNPDGTLKLHLGADLAIQNGTGPVTIIAAGDYTGASAMMLWVDFSSFAIMSPPPPVGSSAPDVHGAVGEILMASVGDHYIAGDGRVNENFGLTSIHHVFHEEHNYQVENLKTWIYAHDLNNSPSTHEGLHEWQTATAYTDSFGNYMFNNTDKTEVSPGVFKANADNIAWDPDKMFNATKLLVEMEYQHAAVDQYARTVTPRIQEFVGYSTGVDSTISLEYAQVAFRFGHSTIRETIDTIDPSGWMLGNVTRYALEKAFLAPQAFAKEGVAAITLGLSRQQMNEVDEFVTPALTQGLLDQPLDLAAINIARGRDMGIPTLNDFRAGISLARYTSWADFGANMIHPESLVNFIAAYSFGGNVTLAQQAMLNSDFMTNKPGVAGADGFEHIDAWIGGLAEAHVPGGLLGETFDAVFVAQIQSLMDGDRFYYLYRLFGTNIHEEVNNGQFKDIVERNTGLSHLNGSIFAYADKYYDFNRGADDKLVSEGGTGAGDHENHLYADVVASSGIFSDGGDSTSDNGTAISVVATDGIRDYSASNGIQNELKLNLIKDTRVNANPDLVHPVEGTPTDGADSHEVIVATDNADFIHARGGDDTVYGEGGNDYIFGDGGVDRLYGGAGDDMIDTGEGPDLADGGAGKDIIYGRGSGSEVGGFDQLVGGSGNDLIIGGEGIDKLSGGQGDDIIYGDGLTNPEMGNTDPFTHGGDGNDYIDGGASGDLLFGEEGDDYIVGGVDQDLMQGGQGDDIIRPGGPSQASGTTGGPDEVVGDDAQANVGFDLIDLSDWAGNATTPGALIDFSTQSNPLVAIDQSTPFPAWFQIEGAIGTKNADTFVGDSAGDATADNSQGNNWLIGGSGNDTFTGNGGNDLIVGGSIRLDTLIGKYSDAGTALNLQLGSTDWLSDAMQSGGNGTGYNNNTQDAYTGASNRSAGTLGNGLLNNVALGTEMFDKHFTDMLQSRMFKDVVLGDGGTDGTADTVVFTGKMSEYSIEVINYVTPDGQNVQALKVTDHGGLIDDGTGVLVPRAEDGVDLIVGVEKAIFSDKPLGVSLIPTPPALDLSGDHVVTTTTTRQYADNFNGTNNPTVLSAANNSTGSTSWAGTSWVESGDDNNIRTGQIQIDSGGGIGSNNLVLRDNGDGASIQRSVDLSGVSSATIGFDVNRNSWDNGEYVEVSFTADSTAAAPIYHTIRTITASSSGVLLNSGNLLSVLNPGEVLTANAAIKFTAFTSATNTGQSSNNGSISIDNLQIDTSTTTTTTVPGAAGSDFSTTYNEGPVRIAIASFPSITDDSATMASAKVVLTNAVAGDTLRIGNSNSSSGTISVPGTDISYSVDTSVAGQITLTLTGTSSLANYQDALSQVRFFNTGDDPTAHGTNTERNISVTVNDGMWTSNIAHTTIAVTGVNDAPNANSDFIVTNQNSVVVSEALLLANDTDVDGPNPLDITNTSVLNSSLTSVSLVTNPGSVTITDNGTAGGSLNYIVSDGLANATGTVNLTRVSGTTITGATGNQNGNRSEILIGGSAAETLQGNGGNDIVRAGGGNDNIVWNVTNSGGGGGGGGGVSTDGHDIIDGGDGTDTFTLTSTVTGNNGNETFDIYTLAEAQAAGIAGLQNIAGEIVVTRNGLVAAELTNVEEIVINTGQGTNQFPTNTGIGDKIFVHGDFTGTGLAYSTITINDKQGGASVDISGLSSDHRIVLNTDANGQVIGDTRPQDVVNRVVTGNSPPVVSGNSAGTPPAHTVNSVQGSDRGEKISGTSDDDMIDAKRGNDTARGGEGHDHFAGSTGDGNDKYYGEGGDDVFVAARNGGNDLYDGGTGDDSLDMSAINSAVSVNLTETGKGWAFDGKTYDTLVSIENVHTGSGDDRVYASTAANHIDTGAGHDTIVFKSAAHANHDVIDGFETGDVIDLSSFMKGTITLVQGETAQAGQIAWHFDAESGNTEVHGTTRDGTHFDFDIRGDHKLTGTDFGM